MQKIYKFKQSKENGKVYLPLYLSRISAGFISPAEDYIDKELDLNDYIIKNPAATFFVKVKGDSMKGAGIFSGDLIVVDRSLPAVNGKIVVAVVNGDFTVKRLILRGEQIFLQPENPDYSLIKIEKETDFAVWGVVSRVIHQV